MVSIAKQLSKKFIHTRFVYIDGWTAAHVLLGIIISASPLGPKLLSTIGLYPKFSLFTAFMILSILWEVFEVIANRTLHVRYFKEPNIDIIWDLVANVIGFWIGNQLQQPF